MSLEYFIIFGVGSCIELLLASVGVGWGGVSFIMVSVA